MKKHILISFFIFSLVCVQNSGYGQIHINEVMFSNKDAHFDSFGTASDWIELYNASDSTISLLDWSITDNPQKNSYWKFPDISIEPQSFLLLFASGKDITNASELHTDFKLSSLHEGVYLYNPHLDLISYIDPICVPRNYSVGYLQDGTGDVFILSPTPGFSNETASVHDFGEYTRADITVSKESGIYSEEIYVRLESTNPNATIYYTLDGTEPHENALLYTDSILIQNRFFEPTLFARIPTGENWEKPRGTTYKASPLRFVAYTAGCKASEVYGKTYFIDSLLYKRYPVLLVSILTDPDNLFDDDTGIYVEGNHTNFNQRGSDWQYRANFEVFKPDGTIVLQQDIDIRIHGNTSRADPQKSLRIYAREEYGTPTFSYPLFENKPHLHDFNILILRAQKQYVLFKEELVQSAIVDLNFEKVATTPAVVFLNGEYWGIKSFFEYQDEAYLQANAHASPDVDIISYDIAVGENARSGDLHAYDDLIYFLQHNDITDASVYNDIKNIIDIPCLIDFFIAQAYFANTDFPVQNLRMWKNRNDEQAKWRYMFYDCDRCMNRIAYNHLDMYAEDRIQEFEWAKIILGTLLKNREFRNQFKQTYIYHLENSFRPDKLIEKIEKLEKIYEPLVVEHANRWRQPADLQQWKYYVNMLKYYAMHRPSYVYEQLKSDFEAPFILYPNPIKSMQEFYIAPLFVGETCSPVSIEITNLNAQVLYTNTSTICDLFTLPISIQSNPGIFMVAITYQNFIWVQKLVIQ